MYSMDDIRKLIVDEVLSKGHLMSLATHDDGGVWVCHVIYVFDDDLSIYWVSRTDTRHSNALLQNPRVAGTISVNHRPKEDDVAVQFSGMAEKLEGNHLAMATKHFAKRGHEPNGRDPGEILKGGQSWYRARPKFFDLTYEPLFGYEKKRYDLA
jgi:uncharacterized protein YhbP (UPF0306 family)